MSKHFRKIPWLAAAFLLALSLIAGTVLAHEGRPVGDYRFIVGWQNEPALENARNAVSVRINKIVAAAPAESGAMNGQHTHNGGAAEAASPMSVSLQADVDSLSGVNVQIITEGFSFSPENVNGQHMDGKGHAHIYVDGVKLSRVYTPWHHLSDLEPGMREIKVILNDNNHNTYTWNGEAVEATTHISVPDPTEATPHPDSETLEAENPIHVCLSLESDPLGGANLFVQIQGIDFSPQNAGLKHIPGEGHAHIYVNDVNVSRLYGNAFQLGKLAEGISEVRVTLNSNNHQTYTRNGQPVEAVAYINIAPGAGGGGYGNPTSPSGTSESESHAHSEGRHSSPPPSGANPSDSALTQQNSQAVPVDGLEGSLQVEVTHPATGASRTMNLYAAFGDPGHYVADLIPTAAGVYEFRVFGTIEGIEMDETFVSLGAGGDFDDIQTSAELQFPEQLPEIREIESGVRGALNTAQQAQDAALAAQNSGNNTLAIVALIVGIIGIVLGAGGIFAALRSRQA